MPSAEATEIRTPRVLVVMTDESERGAYRDALLAKGLDVETAGAAGGCVDGFREGSWTVVVTRQDLPGMSGMFLLSRVKEIDPFCEVILIADHPSVESAMEAKMLGAADYAIAPVTAEELAVRVTAAAERATHARTEKGRGRAPREHADAETGFYAAAPFRDRLTNEFSRAERYEQPLSVAVITLDHLSTYRKVAGEEAAHAAVQKVARILNANTRASDCLGRLGADAFGVLLPHTSAEGAHLAARKLRLVVAEADLPGREALPGEKFEVSAGVATFPTEVRDADALIESALDAARAARNQGGGCVIAA